MIPTIQTERLALRPLCQDDVDPLHAILSVEGMLRYFPNTEPPEQERVERLIGKQLAHWDEHDRGWWAMEPVSGGQLMGWMALQVLETGETEVAYLLAKPHWGKGLATEGARASLRYGFQALGLDEIIGLTHPENIASQRVLEKAGLAFAGEAEYFDMVCRRYIITRAAFEALPPE
jgi:ribosomal-protein-alanine N-acetyltransferase